MKNLLNAKSLLGLIIFTFMIGCAGSNPELVQEKDKEIEQLRAELLQLEKNLDAEKILSLELGTEQEKIKADLAVEQQLNKQYKIQIERLKSGGNSGFVLGNRIVLTSAVLFKGGSAELSDKGLEYMYEIIETLAKYPNREILIEGHTDNVPIAPGYRWKYASNWELSAARALTVLHYFEKNSKVDPKRIAAVAYGEHRPAAKNNFPEGRSQNRRVEIVVGQTLPQK
ncbi:MAG: flagellar motor protein MotB [Candidatus Marinimicrobia bacterium]|nr:flagellar motor protein MotB [Candidatus Neomarinimicrobiota bacterium]